MEILFIARAVNLLGDLGDSVHVRELVSGWLRLGHRVTVLGLGRSDEVPLIRDKGGSSSNAVLVDIDHAWRFYYLRQLLAAWRLVWACHGQKFDVVYSRPGAGLSGAFDVLLETFAARLIGAPLVFEINGWAEDEAGLRDSRFYHLRSLTRRFARRLFATASGFVAVNDSLARLLCESMNVSPDRVRVIHNAANPEKFKPSDTKLARLTLGLHEDERIIEFVGHVGLEADLWPVVRAIPALAAKYPKIRLLVLGDGADLPRYRTLASRLGIESHVIFMGIVPHDRVPICINASDVSLVAIKEGLHSSPMKLFEYWSCAKPVVATETPELAIVEQVGGGLLASSRVPAEWVDAISTLLDSPKLRDEMGALGREFVLKERTWFATASKIVEYLHDVTEAKASKAVQRTR